MSDSVFGTWLKQRRRALDLTQADLGARVGYATATIRKIESGERRPSRDIAERLAQALELAPADYTAFIALARSATLPNQPTAQLMTTAHPAVPGSTERVMQVPVPSTPFIGRASELAELCGLLANSDCRLVSLIGLGGAGKTRLAIEAATKSTTHFADGVVFVSLAAITTADEIAPAIADALGCALYGAEAPHDQLVRYLYERSLLLILDNVEHLLDERVAHVEHITALLGAILQQAPMVKLLVTSRERLRLYDEWVIEIHGLSIPSEVGALAFDSSPAVALFVQQARQVRTDFTPTDADRAAIVQICRLLDGMPLGIELAAAWVRVLSCSEIVEEITRSLDFLAISARDLPARHRSLRAVFEHSWALLCEQERQVLQRLAVFRGGFTRAAVEAICADISSDLHFSTLKVLADLIDQSLLYRHTSGRYQMHELVRQYADDKLTASGEQAVIRQRHCDYYLTWLQSRDAVLRSADQRVAIQEISAEIDNLRAAGNWAIAQGRLRELRSTMRTFGWFYELHGWLREGAAVFEKLVAVLENRPTSDIVDRLTFGQALALQGWYSFRLGRFTQADALLRRSLDLLTQADAPQARADALAFLGNVCYAQGAYAAARQFLLDGLAISRAIGDVWTVAFCQSDLSRLAHLQGDDVAARDWCRASLETWRATGDSRVQVCILSAYAAALCGLGDYAQARARVQEALAISAKLRDVWGLGLALLTLGEVAQAQGEHTEAEYMLYESGNLFGEIGDLEYRARALNALGNVCYADARYNVARSYFSQALEASLAAQALLASLEALVGLACLLLHESAHEEALEVLAYVAAHPAVSAQLHKRVCVQIQCATDVLTPMQAREAQKRGRMLTLEALAATVCEPQYHDLNHVVQAYLQPHRMQIVCGEAALTPKYVSAH